jgi:sugar phosphate isomerase/epimerase
MISISNIAWDISLDDQVSILLNEYKVNLIDIVPSKYFFNPFLVNKNQVLKIKKYWATRGIKPLGMQSLLFGTKSFNIFGSIKVQNAMLDYLSKIFRIAMLLGIKKLVFGSPKNRDKGNLDQRQSQDMAIVFFNRLGEIAKEFNLIICLEPSPEIYQGNFMINSMDTFEMIKIINHNNIRMQLDIGSMIVNKENPYNIIEKVYPLISHIHISEPHLKPLSFINDYHRHSGDAISNFLPNLPITIEILTKSPSTSLDEIKVSLDVINKYYTF